MPRSPLFICFALAACGGAPLSNDAVDAAPLTTVDAGTCAPLDGIYQAQLTRAAVRAGNPSSPHCPPSATVTLTFQAGQLQPSPGPWGHPTTTMSLALDDCSIEVTAQEIYCGTPSRPGMCQQYGEVYFLAGRAGTLLRTFSGNSTTTCQATYDVAL